MAKLERIYQRTDAGLKAWKARPPSLPAEYRRILGLMQDETHSNAIRSALRRYSDEEIFAWLADLEDLGLVASEPVTAKHDLDFTDSLTLRALAAARKAK